MVKRLINKSGAEYIEASFVIPVLVLLTTLLIMISVQYYTCFIQQVDNNSRLLKKIEASDATYKKIKQNKYAHFDIIGTKEINGSGYVINESNFKRLSDTFFNKIEDQNLEMNKKEGSWNEK